MDVHLLAGIWGYRARSRKQIDVVSPANPTRRKQLQPVVVAHTPTWHPPTNKRKWTFLSNRVFVPNAGTHIHFSEKHVFLQNGEACKVLSEYALHDDKAWPVNHRLWYGRMEAGAKEGQARLLLPLPLCGEF